MTHVQEATDVEHPRASERRVCRVLGQARSTQRYVGTIRTDEPALIARMHELAEGAAEAAEEEAAGLERERDRAAAPAASESRLVRGHPRPRRGFIELFTTWGVPVHIRSDKGGEFIAATIRRLATLNGVECL